MTQMRMICVTLVGSLLVFTSSEMARGDVDWLGLCKEYGVATGITDPVEQPLQKCQNLINCGSVVVAACTSEAGSCPNPPTDDTLAYDRRMIQVGDCVAPSSTNESDKCWHCKSPKEMICSVRYRYEEFQNNDCLDRCSTPTWYQTDSGKCKP